MALIAWLLIILLLRSSEGVPQNRWRPCVEIKRELRIPCECAVTVSGALKNILSVEVNCDRAVITDEFVPRLVDSTIISFSQRYAGHRGLPIAVTAALPDSLESLDLSNNAIHRLADRLLKGRLALRELRLANNALGDNVNPIFSSNEFHELSNLKLLDLRFNGLRSIEEGIFMGCESLEELYLDFNNFTRLPIDSLKGPRTLKVLSLAGNNIESINYGAFTILGETLLNLNLSNNEILRVEDGAFTGMASLVVLNLSNNNLQHLNSDSLKGAYNLERLDVSANFLESFPTEVLHHLESLKFLNISDNLITELERQHFEDLKSLQILDLSRNNIGRLGPNAFTDLSQLVRLDLSLNVLRAIDESSFRGLSNLKWLSIKDNNILLAPSPALEQLPSLVELHLEFNRIASLSGESLGCESRSLTELNFGQNLVRELPGRVLASCERLVRLDLSGNLLTALESESLAGLEGELQHLDLSSNQLSRIEPGALALPNLLTLSLAGNRLTKISPDTFERLGQLRDFDISGNPLHTGFPPLFPATLARLEASRTGLRLLPAVLLLNLAELEELSLQANRLAEIGPATFRRQPNLTSLELADNGIRALGRAAFAGLRALRRLSLARNQLRYFAAEHFDESATELEELDLSGNELERLGATAFQAHPRLRLLNLASNRLVGFAGGEVLRPLQLLERLDVSSNRLSSVGEFAFSRLARLRELSLADNAIEQLGDLAFHNSTQLQFIDLSANRLESGLAERSLEGLERLRLLDLSGNRLSTLPEGLLDTSRLRLLEGLRLAGNRFAALPVRALAAQSFGLLELDLSRSAPLPLAASSSQEPLARLRLLDLSGCTRPLSGPASRAILGEAKVLRELSLAGCGLLGLPARLEAPYLRRLNLSDNRLERLPAGFFERATMLEVLDLSGNGRLKELAGLQLPGLRHLDLSGTGLEQVDEALLSGFPGLHSLGLGRLADCTRLEVAGFQRLGKLRELRVHGYPRLGYLDAEGLARAVGRRLELLDLEPKDLSVGGEQLQSARRHPRLLRLALRGVRLRAVHPGLLVGARAPRLELAFLQTSLDSLPVGLLGPVPRSSRVVLELSGSLASSTGNLLAVLGERVPAYTELRGLNASLKCDCTAKALWRWREAFAVREYNAVVCSAPKLLLGRALASLAEAHLAVCDPTMAFDVADEALALPTNGSSSSTTTTVDSSTTEQPSRPTMSSEPVIIWTVAPSYPDLKMKKTSYEKPAVHDMPDIGSSSSSNVDDILIIGVIGGFVALTIILVIICLCRVRCSEPAIGSGIHDASMLRPASNFGSKSNQELYLSSYNGSTLGHTGNAAIMPTPAMSASPVQMLPLVQPLSIIHSSSGSQSVYGYYDNPPIYVTSSDNKYD